MARAIGVNYRGEDDGPYETPEKIDELLDKLRTDTVETGDGLTAMVYRRGDDEFDGPMMEIGVNGDKGYVVWNDPPCREGAISYGGDVPGFVYYLFQGQQAEQAAKHEIDYATVKQAVKEFMASDGGKPVSVPWEPPSA